ncbi:MAG: hypothetical protein ACKV2Q_18555 [Planctomycetaceae bacterium]
MPLSVKVPPDIEKRVRRQAADQGLDPQGLVVETLRRLFPARRSVKTNVLDAVETKLFKRINTALPTETRRRYDELVKKCRSNRISKADHAELLRLTDVVEVAHADRIAAVVELSQYRGVDFDQLLDELGLRTPCLDFERGEK